MKLKISIYIATGFLLPWLLSSIFSIDTMINAYLLLPLIGIIHELLHLFSLKILGLSYKFVVQGLYIGFSIRAARHSDIVKAATFPQIVDPVLLLLYISSGNPIPIVLLVYHILLSSEDMIKVFKHLYSGLHRWNGAYG